MINGYRRYDLRGGTLEGATGTVWNERELIAICKKGARAKEAQLALAAVHLANDIDCSCGIYITKSEHIADYTSFPVLAAVTGWGGYVEYEKGWRVQYARIEHLWVNYNGKKVDIDLDILAEKYGVAVEATTNVGSWAAPPSTRTSIAINPQQCVKCGNIHDLSPWTPKGRAPLLVCQMDTGHVVNAKKYLENLASIGMAAPWHSKWIKIFEDSIAQRQPTTDSSGTVHVKW